MTSRFALAMLGLIAAPAAAQDAPPPAPAVAPAVPPAPPVPPVPKPEPATVRVTLVTGEGPIVVAVETERAPLTAANFLKYVDGKRLDGTAFYRAANIAPGFGLVQAGTRNDPKKTLPAIRHEPTSTTGLHHGDGTLSMARAASGTASGDFFIVVGDMPTMDADPAAPGDNLGFAAFGHVVEGMDVVRRILVAPTSPTDGEGAMKGQMLAPVVRIVSARRG
ncbi:MAG: peptidylprolyl isomerase [Sphingomonas fennica]